MKLQTKLIIAFVVITLLVIVQGITTFNSTQETTGNFEAILQHTTPAINALDKMKAAETALVQEVFSYSLKTQFGVLTGISMINNQELQRFQSNWGLMEEGLNEYRTAAYDGEETELTLALRRSSMAVYQSGLTFLTLSTQVNDAEILSQALNTLAQVSGEYVGLLQEALQTESAKLRELSEISNQSASQSLILNLVSSIVLIATTVGIGFIVVRTVAKPIRELEGTAKQITQGDYSQRIAVTSSDEIGRMTATFNVMADAIQKRDLELSELNTALERRVIETQQAREHAEKSDQVKSTFLASMSHELRTPLNSIINFTKFVAKGIMGPVSDEQVEALGKVVGSATHLLNLINDVLDISKIESGSLRLFVEESIDVREILESIVSTAGGLVMEKPVTLDLHISETLPLIRGDRQRIFQIMLNIVSNACKFTDAGIIQISARQNDDDILLAVKDSGPGIPPEDHAAVFESFKQTETGLRHGSGTGLGMPISKNLVEAHGGRLWLESTLGEGATFYITLPIQSEILALVAL
ncbi:MAG: HAMP domain-containing protein [Burkholderiales bacterium]|nr:HAMP domain-containing protein [Anaerolineae bacterium]